MGYIEEHKEILQKVMSMLEHQFGPDSEIVLHDLTLPYEHTIVDIKNAHVTGRSVGGSVSNLGLEVLRGTVHGGDRYNYVTYLKSSRILRSSTIHFYDRDNKLAAALCVNTDITDSVRFEEYLKSRNKFALPAEAEQADNKTRADSDYVEFIPDSVQNLLDYLVSEAQKAVGVPANKMTKEDKIRFLSLLDKKGAFLISKSSEKMCEYLGISKFSLYKYLETSRSESEDAADADECDADATAG